MYPIHLLLAYFFIVTKSAYIREVSREFREVSSITGEEIIANSNGSIVLTEYGYIEGILTTTARVFRKIPYARPPVNRSGRWQSPTEPTSWGTSSIYQAKGDPPACPQKWCEQWEACGKIETQIYSEDCLYLNVYTPINMSYSYSDSYSDSEGELLPVMFFIHGGTFMTGYGGGYLYNGTDMTNLTNVITVTINYRLGILGYYWNDKYDFAGNYGMEDQILALKWVYNNIEAFGGDKNKITLFGQSAGAMSISLLMMVPEISNLYQGAIWESQPLGLPMRNKKTWGEIPESFVNLADCDRYFDNKSKMLDCLYSLDATDIISIQIQIDASFVELEKFMDAFVPWTPTLGTGLFAGQPVWEYQNGTYTANDKPLIAGVVKNEANLFIYGAFPDGISYDELEILMHIILRTQANVDKVVEQYPIPINVTDYRDYASDVVTDGLFHCPNRNLSSILSQRSENNGKNYFYHFEHLPSFSGAIWDKMNATECLDKICHGDDLPFVFRPNTGPINVSYTDTEWNLAQVMQFYWTQFGKSGGNPGDGHTNKLNNGTIVQWQQFDATSGKENTMVFRAGDIQMIENYDKEKCVIWDEINYPWLPHP